MHVVQLYIYWKFNNNIYDLFEIYYKISYTSIYLMINSVVYYFSNFALVHQ